MRPLFSKLPIVLVLFAVSLFITSCEKEVVTSDISPENVQKNAALDAATDESESIVEDSFINQENMSARTTSEASSYLSPCVTTTIVISGMTRTITLDFGAGCTMANGNVISGILVVVYNFNPTAMSTQITYTYDNFTFNGIALSGGGTINRVLENANGNPESTAVIDVTATWANGTSAHRTGTKIREWVEGFGTGIWNDNVYEITGNWTTNFSDGDVNAGLVLTPLRRELSCQYLVSGTVQLSHNTYVGVLDFGNGTCDNLAIFTGPNGFTTTIVLD